MHPVIGDTIELVIHWQGGDHTRLIVPKNRTGQHRWSAEQSWWSRIKWIVNDI
jgi:hypothetical protein